MAVLVCFEKTKVKTFVKALANGTPIKGVKSPYDMLALAGACVSVATADPFRLLPRIIDVSKLHREQLEAVLENFDRDVFAAVEIYSILTLDVLSGEYDKKFENLHIALVADDGDRFVIKPLVGLKSKSGVRKVDKKSTTSPDQLAGRRVDGSAQNNGKGD